MENNYRLANNIFAFQNMPFIGCPKHNNFISRCFQCFLNLFLAVFLVVLEGGKRVHVLAPSDQNLHFKTLFPKIQNRPLIDQSLLRQTNLELGKFPPFPSFGLRWGIALATTQQLMMRSADRVAQAAESRHH